jgi:hypothetical protein
MYLTTIQDLKILGFGGYARLDRLGFGEHAKLNTLPIFFGY